MFFVGIDIGKNNHVASMLDDTGKVVFKAFSFPNTSDGGNALFSKLASYSLNPSDFEIGMEATGHYWLSVYSFLFEKRFLLHVINPIQTDGWRRGTEIRRRKNDIIDSILIADLIRYGQFVETRLADEELFSLRTLTRFRTYLVESISDLKRKVVCVLDQVFPEYQSIFSDIFGKTSKEILLQFSSPIDFEPVSSETLAELLAQLSRQKAGTAKAEQLKAANCLGSFQKNYQKDEIILLESNEVRSVGIILSGIVHMVKEDSEGYQTLLVAMKDGELFGESFSCGSHLDAHVSFFAAAPCTVLFLPFHKIIHSCKMSCTFHHRLIENMVQLIGDKNVQLMHKIEVISKKTLREKILTYLQQQTLDQDSRQFTIPLSRLELAKYLCADRSALTRELSYMQKDGLISYEKNTFQLL